MDVSDPANSAAPDYASSYPDRPWHIDGGTFSPNFANLDSGWYFSTTNPTYAQESDACLNWWCPACDVVLEAYLRKHGVLAPAFQREIRDRINAELECAGPFPRYWEYFLISRVLSEPNLRKLFVDDYIARGRTTWNCEQCGTPQRLDYVRGSLVAQTGGVLPLCDRCWTWLSIIVPMRGLTKVPPILGERLRELSTSCRCPICARDSSWIADSNQSSYSVPLLPERYFEICQSCCTRSVLGSNRSSVTDTDLADLRRVSEIVSGVPTESSVLYDHAPNLDAAIEVARILGAMPSRTLMKQHAGSWLKLLIASGILPDGTRKTTFGTMVVARDGHACLSLAEKEIDDLFSEHGIAHEREPCYPGTEYKADWSFELQGKTVFVEYFGLVSRAAYAKRMRAKLEVASAVGLEVIQFVPADLKDLRLAFRERILSRLSG